jgi:hypothetical protein
VKKLSLRDDKDGKSRRGEGVLPGADAQAPHQDLNRAIDDYVAKLTGDRTALHAPNHSIGWRSTAA